jgi:hypothetical protein
MTPAHRIEVVLSVARSMSAGQPLRGSVLRYDRPTDPLEEFKEDL